MIAVDQVSADAAASGRRPARRCKRLDGRGAPAHSVGTLSASAVWPLRKDQNDHVYVIVKDRYVVAFARIDWLILGLMDAFRKTPK